MDTIYNRREWENSLSVEHRRACTEERSEKSEIALKGVFVIDEKWAIHIII